MTCNSPICRCHDHSCILSVNVMAAKLGCPRADGSAIGTLRTTCRRTRAQVTRPAARSRPSRPKPANAAKRIHDTHARSALLESGDLKGWQVGGFFFFFFFFAILSLGIIARIAMLKKVAQTCFLPRPRAYRLQPARRTARSTA